MTPSQQKSLIKMYTDETWNRGDIAAMDRFYARDYIHHDVSRPDVRTLDDYKQWGRDLLAGLSKLNVAIDQLVSDEGRTVKAWTATGIHSGPIAGIPPSGRKISFSGVSIYRIANDKIAESWYIYDLFGLLQQLQAPVAVA
jgi:steroid delta-isomerase-like uncharacterized protein